MDKLRGVDEPHVDRAYPAAPCSPSHVTHLRPALDQLYTSAPYAERAEQDKDLLDLISSSGLVGERTVSM